MYSLSFLLDKSIIPWNVLYEIGIFGDRMKFRVDGPSNAWFGIALSTSTNMNGAIVFLYDNAASK